MPIKSKKISDWISDFQDSDDKSFKGKSKAKRREMAIAAYYAKYPKGVEEETTTAAVAIPEKPIKRTPIKRTLSEIFNITEKVQNVSWLRKTNDYIYDIQPLFPLGPAFQRVFEPKSDEIAFHLTSVTNAERVLKLQNKKTANLSVSQRVNQSAFLKGRVLSGDHAAAYGTDKADVLLKLNGHIVTGQNYDMMSQPDTSGYRWIDLNGFIKNIDNKDLSQLMKLKDEFYKIKGQIFLKYKYPVFEGLPTKILASHAVTLGVEGKTPEVILPAIYEYIDSRIKPLDNEKRFLFINRIFGNLRKHINPQIKMRIVKDFYDETEKLLMKYKTDIDHMIHTSFGNNYPVDWYDEHIMNNFTVIAALPRTEEVMSQLISDISPLHSYFPRGLVDGNDYDDTGMIRNTYLTDFLMS